MLNRFHSAVVEVQDFDLAVAHYATLLGREPSWLGRNGERGSRSALFRLAHMTLELCDPGSGSEIEEGLSGLRLGAPSDLDVPEWTADRNVIVRESTKEVAEDSAGGATREWVRWALDRRSSRGIEIELISEESGPAIPEAAVRADPESTIHDLDHVVVFSGDADSTRDFYADRLGIRLALDKTFDERRVRLLFFRLGNVTIEIGSRLGTPPEPESVDRFGGLAWEVAHVDRIRERLLDERFDVSEVRKGNKPGTRVCTVRSPVHGVPTLLIEPVSR